MAEPPAVQGYVLHTVASDDNPLYAREGDVCQIIRRATANEASESEVLEYGPAFLVRFGDGQTEVVHSVELNPWYPT